MNFYYDPFADRRSPTMSQKARALPPAAVCWMPVWVSAARISNW